MEWDLQQYLTEMREEQQADHRELSGKIDGLVKVVSKHETRLVVVENTRRLLIWASGALVVGVIGFIFDMLKNHLSKGVGQ